MRQGSRCVCPTGTKWNRAYRSCRSTGATASRGCVGGSVRRGNRCACPAGTAWNRATRHCAGAAANVRCPQGQFYSKPKRRCVTRGRLCRALACSSRTGSCQSQQYYENSPKDARTAALTRCNQSMGSCSYQRTCCSSGSGAIIAKRVGNRSYRFTSFACGSSVPDAAVPGLRQCGSRSRCTIGARWNYSLAGGSGSGGGNGAGSGTAGKKKKPGADGDPAGGGNGPKKKKKKAKKPPVTEERPEAIAFCWSKKSNPGFNEKKWYCHGPVQKTSYTAETLAQKAYYVGCSKANWSAKRYSHSSGGKSGIIIFCNRYQRSYDHKIAQIYGVPSTILARRKIYVCPKNSSRDNQCKVK